MFVFVCLGLSLAASRDKQSNGPLRPSSCGQASVERVMINPLPVELKDGVANLDAVAVTSIHSRDLGSAGVRPEVIYARASSAVIVHHRSRRQ